MKTVWITYQGLIDKEKDNKLIRAMRNVGCQCIDSAFSLHHMQRSVIFECSETTGNILDKIDWSKHNLEAEVLPF